MNLEKITPRRAALEILGEWEESRLPLSLLRDRVFKRFSLPDPRDRALVNLLIFGLARGLNRIDHYLSLRSKKPFARLDRRVRAALRLGLFELLDFGADRPASVVNESVAAVRAAGAPKWLAGFVNAVLRGFVRQGLPDGSLPLHLELGHPRWLLDRWQARYGNDAARKIAGENNRQPDLCLRARSGDRENFLSVLAASGITAHPGRISPEAIILPGFTGRVESIPGYGQGRFAVMDEAAQLVCRMALAGEQRPTQILDACAGVGGKSACLADLADGETRVVAVEPEISRRELLGKNIARLGLADRVEVRAGTIGGLAGGDEKFDLVLVDSPCSGLGVIRRHPDIRWNRNEGDIVALAARQKEILQEAATLVAPGGVLLYAVCSLEPEEGRDLVDSFLADGRFSLEDVGDFLAGGGEDLVDGGFFTSIPGMHGMDGFFAARLRRK